MSAVLTRVGMRDSNPVTGAMVGTLVQVVVLGSLVAAQPPAEINIMGLVFFVASGILASTLGRLFNYTSIERLGVPMSATIIGSSPLFSTLLAVVFIREAVSVTTLLGTLLIVGGVAVTSGKGGSAPSLRDSAILLPVTAAFLYGASSVTRKIGMNLLPDSTLGAFVGTASSLVFFLAYIIGPGRLGTVKVTRNSGPYFVASGLVVSAGWLSMYSAIAEGSVSVVSALIGTNPLFSLTLSLIFLRDMEALDRSVAAGCLAIVAGAIIITLF